ncbi:hypothetical protein GE09DRAFT_251367 [Coniochaeta sp. 2T2.1]|nr:hypothetical protein GE09DRAFT_251367 [Coniochaeta sp. 2T2.1]
MLPTTPQLNFSHPAGPTSPPETPRTASPVFNRQSSPKFRGPLSRNKAGKRPMAQQSNARAASAHGPGFNFGRPTREDQLSPQSTSSSESSTDSDSSDAESITTDHPLASSFPNNPRPTAVTTTTRITHAPTFTVEEMGNFEPGDEERRTALRPDHFEYPESDRSRSRSRNPPEIDQTVMYKFRNLDCASTSSESDETDFDEDDYQRFLVRRRLEKRHKRMSSGSIGKRSITESIGSDTDMEDLKVQYLDAVLAGGKAGGSAGAGGVRRVKRKLGNRQSLQGLEPPLPRIDQADEPETSEDEFLDDDALKELPYYTLDYITMEIDSP